MNDMNDKSQIYYDEYEIDLKEYINTLWNNKWLIIALFICGVLIAGFYSQFMISPQYEAKSTLLILPPKYKTSLDVSTFPIETYKNLAQTQTMKSKVIKELDLKHKDGSPYTVSDLNGMMEIQVEAQNENNKINSSNVPLLELKVTGSNPQLISKISNSWADNFMEVTKQIRKSEVQEVSKVIQNQFKITKQKLLNTKQDLKEFNKQKRLKLVKEELSIKEKHLSAYKDKLIALKSKLGSEKANYQRLQDSVSRLEEQGKWIGSLNNNSSSRRNSLTVRTKSNYLEAQNNMLAYKKDHDVEFMQEKISVKNRELRTYKNKIIELKSTLEDKIVEVDKITKLLEDLPDRWSIKKSVSDDIFWEKILTSEEIDILQDMQLTNEVINPVYQKLKTKLSDSKILVGSIPEQINYYTRMTLELEKELKDLNYTMTKWTQKIDRLKIDIKNQKILYESQADTYQNLKNELTQSRLSINSMESQIAFYKQKKNSFEQEVKDLQDFIWENEIKQQQLIQQVNDIQKNYNNLAQKVEEASITEAQKTSDVKFISRSVPPTKAISPDKKLIVAIAGVLSLMIAVFIVFIKEVMKD